MGQLVSTFMGEEQVTNEEEYSPGREAMSREGVTYAAPCSSPNMVPFKDGSSQLATRQDSMQGNRNQSFATQNGSAGRSSSFASMPVAFKDGSSQIMTRPSFSGYPDQNLMTTMRPQQQPGAYKVGDEIEIWSNSQNAWCRGNVSRVDAELVGIKYVSRDGQKITKLMPFAHEHLRHADTQQQQQQQQQHQQEQQRLQQQQEQYQREQQQRQQTLDSQNGNQMQRGMSFPAMPVPFKDGSSQLMTRPTFCVQALQGQYEDPQQNLVGGSFLRSDAYRQREAQFFISDPEDIVDVQIAEYFNVQPNVYLRTRLTRIRPGFYAMFEGAGREVAVVWEGPSKKQGQLVVRDGTLKQPFHDYLANKCPSHSDMNGSFYQTQGQSQNMPQLPEEVVAMYDEIIDRKRDQRANDRMAKARSVALQQPPRGGHTGGGTAGFAALLGGRQF